MDFRVAALGLIVGLLVGLTGTGGGALLTPLLILLGWATPTIAVGTDLVWSTITKAAGGVVHWRQGTVDFTIVKRLAVGSIPGAAAGLLLLSHMRALGIEHSDRLVVRMLGATLVAVAISLFVRFFHRGSRQLVSVSRSLSDRAWVTTAVGAIVGFIVSLTSIGSGSLIIACLVILYRQEPLRRIVGSDIVHALLLSGIAALGYMHMGNINLPLMAALLVGSIPGVLLGSKMTAIVPDRAMQPVLATTLLLLGYKLL